MRNSLWIQAIIVAGASFIANVASAQSLPGVSGGSPGTAQTIRLAQNDAGTQPVTRDDFVEEINANTVTVVSGNPNGTYLFLAYDLSAVLDDGNNLRVLPVVGLGGGQNTKDVLYLRGIDMGLMQSAVLRYYERTGEVGRNIANRLRYITRLYNEEMHLLVAANINSIEELRGKKVNFSDKGSGTEISSRLIFDDLKIEVEEVNMGQGDAFEAIKRGEIAATVLIAGKPSGSYAKLQAGTEFKLLPVPYEGTLQENYLPATLTHEDYPGLIPEGQTVNTVAASAVLGVFNWAPNTERYRRVAKFTQALFKNFDKLLEKPRHPKWKEVNLAATLPGWERFGEAQRLLDETPAQAASSENPKLKQAFDQFLAQASPTGAENISAEQRDALFRKFLEWQSTLTSQ